MVVAVVIKENEVFYTSITRLLNNIRLDDDESKEIKKQRKKQND